MTCLHRQVDVITDFRQHCHRLDQVIGHVIGMGGEEPDPFQTGQVVKCVQEVRQARWRRQILTIRIDGLTQKHQFPGTLCQ